MWMKSNITHMVSLTAYPRTYRDLGLRENIIWACGAIYQHNLGLCSQELMNRCRRHYHAHRKMQDDLSRSVMNSVAQIHPNRLKSFKLPYSGKRHTILSAIFTSIWKGLPKASNCKLNCRVDILKKKFLRSEAVTCAVKVVIYQKRCKYVAKQYLSTSIKVFDDIASVAIYK